MEDGYWVIAIDSGRLSRLPETGAIAEFEWVGPDHVDETEC